MGDKWSCLTQRPASPAVLADRNRPLAYRGAWLDIGTRAAPPNLRARACSIADPGCSQPLTPYVAADANGVLQLQLFHGFAGYLEVLSDVTVPTLAFFASTFTADTSTVFDEGVNRMLVQPGAFVTLADLNGVEIQPAAGYVGVFSLDCFGNLVEDVELSLDYAGAIRFYFSNNFPSISLQTTTTEGYGGFVNVPGGQATVSATHAPTGELVRTASLFVRPGWGSTIVLSPYASPSGG